MHGIPEHKRNLLLYKDYYNLDKSYHNFIIIFNHDKQIKFLTSEYRNRFITYNRYLKLVREHLDYAYGLRLGNQVKNVFKAGI